MDDLNQLERDVLQKLLDGQHPILEKLRVQAAHALVSRREYTGVGFFCELAVPLDVPSLQGIGDFHLSDVSADLDGLKYGAGFILFVRDGRLAMLEGSTYEEPWPPQIKNLTFTYWHEPRKFPF